MKNAKIKIALLEHKMPQYELARIMGVSEATLGRKLRYELSEQEQDDIVKLIDEQEDKA